VDDVVTQGSLAVKAVRQVKDLVCEVVLVQALGDRLQAAEALVQAGGVANYR
jgi:orotate phosphoribosyltransferase